MIEVRIKVITMNKPQFLADMSATLLQSVAPAPYGPPYPKIVKQYNIIVYAQNLALDNSLKFCDEEWT